MILSIFIFRAPHPYLSENRLLGEIFLAIQNRDSIMDSDNKLTFSSATTTTDTPYLMSTSVFAPSFTLNRKKRDTEQAGLGVAEGTPASQKIKTGLDEEKNTNATQLTECFFKTEWEGNQLFKNT